MLGPNPWIFSRQATVLPRVPACPWHAKTPKCPSPTILTRERNAIQTLVRLLTHQSDILDSPILGVTIPVVCILHSSTSQSTPEPRTYFPIQSQHGDQSRRCGSQRDAHPRARPQAAEADNRPLQCVFSLLSYASTLQSPDASNHVRSPAKSARTAWSRPSTTTSWSRSLAQRRLTTSCSPASSA